MLRNPIGLFPGPQLPPIHPVRVQFDGFVPLTRRAASTSTSGSIKFRRPCWGQGRSLLRRNALQYINHLIYLKHISLEWQKYLAFRYEKSYLSTSIKVESFRYWVKKYKSTLIFWDYVGIRGLSEYAVFNSVHNNPNVSLRIKKFLFLCTTKPWCVPYLTP